MSSSLQQVFALAFQHHQAGRLAEAEVLYRQILAAQPQHADALHLLGVVAHQSGDSARAVELIGQALRWMPNAPVFHSNFGEALRQLGRVDEAIASYRRALALQPSYADAHNNLGNALRECGRIDEAIAECGAAIQCRPDHAEAHNNLGNALREAGRWEEALASYRTALGLQPSHAAIQLNLGAALHATQRHEEALAAYQRLLQFHPNYADAHNNLGNTLMDLGRLDDAAAAFRRALELRPDYADACSNLGVVLGKLGEIDESMACFRRAMALHPRDPRRHSNLVYTAHFHPGYDLAALRAECAEWERLHGEPLRDAWPTHRHSRDPARRLRIGYVSPDFCQQAECFFTLPLIEAHDHTAFEIHCYASVMRPDLVTDRLRRCADGWHDVLGVSDEALAQRIAADGIDILVDLSMHMAGNRLPLFARKPAPVQVTWLAYPGSTGLGAIDYRFTDARMEPETLADWSVEKVVRLPDSWCCYSPVCDSPPVNALPALSTGHLTFGSLNNFAKINDAVLARWAGVLRAVPGSRLLMLCAPGRSRQRVGDFLRAHGIACERVEFVASSPRLAYLAHFHRIDLALDPVPYNGITTTCDALWMGVPVLTVPGEVPAARASLSLLTSVGLEEFALPTDAACEEKAAALARDLPRLAHLRATLRARLSASPLMDGPRFARHVEQAYRAMWLAWCASY